MTKTVDVLNAAFAADPNAIHAILTTVIPCNLALASNAHIPVDASPVLPEPHFRLTPLGLINGVLSANGLPLVAAMFSDDPNLRGGRDLIGFCEYKPPAPQKT